MYRFKIEHAPRVEISFQIKTIDKNTYNIAGLKITKGPIAVQSNKVNTYKTIINVNENIQTTN